MTFIRLKKGWVSVYSIDNALGFVLERFSFRISDGAWAVLLGFYDFPESIHGNGGLESGLCHCHLPPNPSQFIINHSTIGRYISYNGNNGVFILRSSQLKEASFTPLQALAFWYLFNNFGVSSGERNIYNFYLIYDYIPRVTNDGYYKKNPCAYSESRAIKFVYKYTMVYQSNTTQLYYVYYCIRATCFDSYRIIFRPF